MLSGNNCHTRTSRDAESMDSDASGSHISCRKENRASRESATWAES